MVTEKGIVAELSGHKVQVRVQKSSACASCEARHGCHIHNTKEMMVDVNNDLRAKVGDLVEISVPTGAFLRTSLLVYFLPVLALIFGAYAGGAWAASLHLPPTLASVLGGALAMALSFAILRRIDRAAQSRAEFSPRMTRILVNAPVRQPDDSK
jgi:sigma-E factor negative regulatory protein RseC